MHAAKRVSLCIDRGDEIGEISENLMGSFLEHVGRAIYTGIYEPEHPTANADGFRGDVIEAVRALGVPMVRYPGGNFVSGYRWTDGIGEKSRRPHRPELAWKAIETNQVGIDEFAKWAEAAGCRVMPAVNMGTGTPQEAADFVEYCNFPCGTFWSDKRRENGREKPYGFRYWCVGNEMDGDWQIGHLSAQEYGRKACEAAKMMKWMDKSIHITVAGSSSPDLPTFPEWDRVVLEKTYENVDFLSLHRYYGYNPAVMRSCDYLHAYLDMDRFIRSVIATADYVKALHRSKKTIMLSFDEWNVWHQHQAIDETHEWAQVRPILEDTYSVRDALLFSGMMMTLINHADRVKIGCMAQLVNVIAPLLTRPGGGIVRQTIYYPYQAGCRYAKGRALHCRVRGEKAETAYGDADPVYAASAYDEAAGLLTIFILNSTEEPIQLSLRLEGFEEVRLAQHQVFVGPDLDSRNTFAQPDKARMTERQVNPEGGEIAVDRYSFHVLHYKKPDGGVGL